MTQTRPRREPARQTPQRDVPLNQDRTAGSFLVSETVNSAQTHGGGLDFLQRAATAAIALLEGQS